MKKLLTWKTLGYIITLFATFMLLTSGVNKLISEEETLKNFEFMKLTPYMFFIGLLEFAASIMILLPKTSRYGIVLMTSLMSGAVALHLSFMGGAQVLMPISVLLAGWTGYCLREYMD